MTTSPDIVVEGAVARIQARFHPHYGIDGATDSLQLAQDCKTLIAALTAHSDHKRLIAELVGALRPFARHVDKRTEAITLKWGDSTYTGTLKPEDFYRAREAITLARQIGDKA